LTREITIYAALIREIGIDKTINLLVLYTNINMSGSGMFIAAKDVVQRNTHVRVMFAPALSANQNRQSLKINNTPFFKGQR